MKKTLLFTIAASTLLACNSPQKTTQPQKEKEMTTLTNREKAKSLLVSLETGDKTSVGYINPNKYIQHNLMVADGLEGFGAVLKHAPEGGFKANVVRAFQDGDYVFTHTVYDFFGPKIGFDIFRFEEDRIVEHWDNLTEVTKLNPSGHSQTDGTLDISDLDKTDENKAFVKAFVNTVLVEGNFDKLGEYIDSENYTQHNSHIADGLSGLGSAVAEMAKNGVTMKFDKVHQVLGEGNFVLTISEGEFAGKHTSFYDLFRVENNKIVEHWDVLETILPESEHKNKNGKFNF